jgi:cation diffusion facilitator CzcD-associated flavoprotein CzcO
MTIDELEERVRFDLACLAYPERAWVMPPAQPEILDAVIVGGGQTGVAIAFALQRARVDHIAVLDRNPAGFEGPWRTYARMHTLRTPKSVTGPDLGVPSLSLRAWYEASFGHDAWTDLAKLPRETWQGYLLWVRRMAGVRVQNGIEIIDVEPLADGLIALHAVDASGRARRLVTRNVVLATGAEGSGAWQIPGPIAALPRDRFAHTADAIDFTALRGRRVAVVGAGASAFDNAAVALEHGAASVMLYARRAALPAVNPYRWMEFAGFQAHFGDLADDLKWRFMRHIFGMNQPPPQETFSRCARHGNFTVHMGEAIVAATVYGAGVRLTTSTRVDDVDFVIVGTGFVVDLACRPELVRIEPAIARWRDVYTPPAGDEDAVLGGFPYLGPGFEFTERRPGAAPYLSRIFSSTFAAMPSLGSSAGVSSLRASVDRIARGVTRNLFVAEAEAHFASLVAYNEPELTSTELASAAKEPSW